MAFMNGRKIFGLLGRAHGDEMRDTIIMLAMI